MAGGCLDYQLPNRTVPSSSLDSIHDFSRETLEATLFDLSSFTILAFQKPSYKPTMNLPPTAPAAQLSQLSQLESPGLGARTHPLDPSQTSS